MEKNVRFPFIVTSVSDVFDFPFEARFNFIMCNQKTIFILNGSCLLFKSRI